MQYVVFLYTLFYFHLIIDSFCSGSGFQPDRSFFRGWCRILFSKFQGSDFPQSRIRLMTNRWNNLSFNKDIDNTLNYEDCYTKLLDKVKDKSIEEKIYFLAPYIPYLLAILNDFSAVEDAYAYDDRFRNNETIAFIIVYRYEHNISVLDDLRLEKSGEDACRYHSRIVDRLIDEKYAKINELKKYKPDEYQKYLNNWRKENQRIKETVNEIRSGFWNKWAKLQTWQYWTFLKKCNFNFPVWSIIVSLKK